MADYSQKKTSFVRRYLEALDKLISAVNDLGDLKDEWDANAYATGANPTERNIADADLEIAPWVTAAGLNSAVGAVEAIKTTVNSQRGYIEQVRG